MFSDSAKIFIKAGDGGNGAVTFHREKYVAGGTAATEEKAEMSFLLLIRMLIRWLISDTKENLPLRTAETAETRTGMAKTESILGLTSLLEL